MADPHVRVTVDALVLAETAQLGTAHGDNPDYHRIARGIFECTAPPDAPCRTSPTCDCENWCCDDPEDHDEGEHCCMTTTKPGQGCWMEPWVNGDLDGSFDHEAQASPADYDLVTGEHTWPDGSVTCDWDESVVWRYIVCPPAGGEDRG